MLHVIQTLARVNRDVVVEERTARRFMYERADLVSIKRECKVCESVCEGDLIGKHIVDVDRGSVEAHRDRAGLRLSRIVCCIVPRPAENLRGV